MLVGVILTQRAYPSINKLGWWCVSVAGVSVAVCPTDRSTTISKYQDQVAPVPGRISARGVTESIILEEQRCISVTILGCQ